MQRSPFPREPLPIPPTPALSEVPSPADTKTLEEHVDDFLTDLRVKNRSPHTLKAYGSDLRQFVQFCASVAAPALGQMDYKFLRTFLVHLCDERVVKGRSRARKRAALKMFFGYLWRQKVVPFNIVRYIGRPKFSEPLPDVPTISEVQALIDFVGRGGTARDRLIFELFYGCGLRLNELTGINLPDIDQTDRWITIRGKGMKERQVPYGTKAAEALTAYLRVRASVCAGDSDGALLLNFQHRHPARFDDLVFCPRLSDRSVERLVHRYAVLYWAFRPTPDEERILQWYGEAPLDRAETLMGIALHRLQERRLESGRRGHNLFDDPEAEPEALARAKKLHCHVLRHAYATHLLNKSGDLRVVQELLGHESVSTTARYCSVAIEDLKRVYDKAHPRADLAE
jgi:integrase/recombinase XerC